MGDVGGQRVCNVQGSHGRIAVALALLGAQATVLGRKLKLSLRDAPLANGQMGHVLDFDDTHMGSVVLHTSSPVLAALFDMLRSGELIERGETDAEAYMRVAGQRYVLLRTHEWSDEVLDRLRRTDKKRRRLPPRRRRARRV